MDKLAGFRKMNVFFFGNEDEKRAFYLECICPFMDTIRKGQYYATRDWNGGPNTEVVYAGEPIDVKALRHEIRRYCLDAGTDSAESGKLQKEPEKPAENGEKGQSSDPVKESPEGQGCRAGRGLLPPDIQQQRTCETAF